MEPQSSQPQQPVDLKNSNFFVGIEPTTQSNQPNISNPLTQPNYLPNQPQQSTQTTFLEKVNSTASGVFDFIKKQTPANIIPKKLLSDNIPIEDLTKIDIDDFDNKINTITKEVETQKLIKTKINDLTILVNITNPREIKNTLFKTNYVLYDIITPQMNWTVNRRYSDFIWLRECLQSLFPADILPMLPKKKIGNRRFQEDFLKKRCQGLQNFLTEIVNKEKYKATEILTIFLSCVERNFFEQQMKTINPKLLLRQSVYSIQSFEGKLKIIDISNNENNYDTFTYFNQITNYLNLQTNTINDINNKLKKYTKCMEDAYMYLEEVEKNFNKLFEISDKVKINNNISNVYTQYEIFFKNWKRIQTSQTFIIKDVVKKFYKDIENKSENLIEILQKEKNIQDNYLNNKNKLMAKKELLWQQMDVTKWELNTSNQIDNERLFKDKLYAQDNMCYKETMDLKLNEELLGYYFYENHKNFKKLMEQLTKTYVKNITDFTNQIYPTFTDFVTVWSTIVSNIPKI